MKWYLEFYFCPQIDFFVPEGYTDTKRQKELECDEKERYYKFNQVFCRGQ